ncbi:MAG: hypothetical protein ABSG68_06425 [Thermoguttaceae bacterium]
MVGSHRYYRRPLAALATAAAVLLACGTGCTVWALLCTAAPAAELAVDCSRTDGAIRPLHGVNTGPLHAGDTLDLSAYYRELGIPLTRLHDCHWPGADVVDIHVLFPDFRADPALPASYDFARTDDYLQTIVKAGSGIVFRLGESIEHSRRKYHVHPPADAAKWAAACVAIIRHYNDGWAGGFHHKIRYWEIWNEPENRPAMWSGSDEDYYRLYATTAKAIKAALPAVLVGGPAAGYAGRMQGDALEPTPFVAGFLDRCTHDAAPLDFFSWHTYTDDPQELVRRARAVRRLLDQHGFRRTENHLNEWNYLPGNDWGAMLSADARARQRWFERLSGPQGAAFTAAALMLLQDAPLDAANYYSADIQGFGLFNEYGVPKKSFYALKAFKMLLDTPARIPLQGAPPAGLAVTAGIDRRRARVTVLASNFSSAEEKLSLRFTGVPWNGETTCEVLLLDAQHDLSRIELRQPFQPGASTGGASGTQREFLVEQDMRPASVHVIRLRPSQATP